MNRNKLLIIISLGIFIFSSCRKEEWKTRGSISDARLSINLLQAIKENPDLSLFNKYLKKTGYDAVLASSKAFTVFAPTNDALEKVDASILNDSVQLDLLIANHIALETFFTKMAQPSLRIKTLNGKHLTFRGAKVNDAEILKADEYVNNGVLHVIDAPLIPRKNIWEYVNSTYKNSLQQKVLKDLDYTFVNPDSAKQIGVDAQTGEPIYEPGTGLVTRNRYLQKVDLDNEDSLLTYVILKDAAFTYEKQKLRPYFQDTTQVQTDSLTDWNIVKDLAFKGEYYPDQLPSVLYSANDSVQFHINKSSIVEVDTASNGIIYVLDHADYQMKTKFKPIIIEAEKFFDRMDPSVSVEYRKRRNLNTDSIFHDILVQNYSLASFWLRYPTTLNSVEYKVYWVAVNDFQTGTFPMRVSFKSHTDTAFADPTHVSFDKELPYHTVPLEDYEEVYVGNYKPDYYGLLDVFLKGNNVTTLGENTIVCDYIKLVPVIN